VNPAQMRRVEDSRRLLQARIDRRGPADMIKRAKRDLEEAIAAANAPAQPQAARRRGWWREFWEGEVGSPLPAREPGKTAAVVGQVIVAITAGAILGCFLRTETGKYATRSLMRALIYRAVKAL
jgi:hypothetical protein